MRSASAGRSSTSTGTSSARSGSGMGVERGCASTSSRLSPATRAGSQTLRDWLGKRARGPAGGAHWAQRSNFCPYAARFAAKPRIGRPHERPALPSSAHAAHGRRRAAAPATTPNDPGKDQLQCTNPVSFSTRRQSERPRYEISCLRVRQTRRGTACDRRRLLPGDSGSPAEGWNEGYRFWDARSGRQYRAQATTGRQPFDAHAKSRFLEAFTTGMTVAAAATAAGFSAGPIYRALQLDPAFAARYAEARHARS